MGTITFCKLLMNDIYIIVLMGLSLKILPIDLHPEEHHKSLEEDFLTLHSSILQLVIPFQNLVDFHLVTL